MSKNKEILKALERRIPFFFGCVVFIGCAILYTQRDDIGWLALGVAQLALIQTIPVKEAKKE